MFTFVLKKFFTIFRKFENNSATNAARPLPDLAKKDTIEMQELKETISRNAATLPSDFAAVVALVVIVYAGLNAPGFF